MQTVTLIGRMGTDVEMRSTSSGTTILNFSFAVSRKKGKEETTTWYKITLFDNEFVGMIPHLKKGTQLIINGDLNRIHPYISKSGEAKVELNVRPHTMKFSPFSRQFSEEENVFVGKKDNVEVGEEDYPF